MSKVIKISDQLVFDDNSTISDYHEQSCCEHHYLDWSQIELSDFDGLEFDLSNDNFLEKVDGYGIRLKPINGFPVSVPGYGNNNGYYSSNLTLVVFTKGKRREIDITDCQEW